MFFFYIFAKLRWIGGGGGVIFARQQTFLHQTFYFDVVNHLLSANLPGIYEQSTRPRPDPVLFHSWGTLNVLLIATEIVEDAASIIRIMFQT